ncbi:hypothetical protein HU200_011785 [Digitaria exilis]|uniref:Uncharacterized protein n=1 Tax=Digitaria exilis TaxID=1010633 RepID=A0A835FGM2_9POAL|nr:hypothetical protein HU200_011785 [Digitaria exilis]
MIVTTQGMNARPPAPHATLNVRLRHLHMQ